MTHSTASLPTAVSFWDGSLCSRLGNQACELWFGVDAKKMPGMALREVIGEVAYAQDLHCILAALGGRDQRFERQLFLPLDHRMRQVRIEYLPELNQGAVLGLCLLVHDITAEKGAVVEPAPDKILLDGLCELAPFGVVLRDLDGNFLEANPAFQSLCGYSAEELRALGAAVMDPGEFSQNERQALEVLLRTGRCGPHERDYVRKDGSLVPVSISSKLIVGSDARNHVWSVVEDLSQRHQASLALSQGRTELQTAQAVSRMGSWSINLSASRISWTPETHHIFGIKPGKSVNVQRFLAIVHRDDRPALRDFWQAAKVGEASKLDHRIVVQGKTRWVREVVQPDFDMDGLHCGYIGTTQDITNDKWAEDRVQQTELLLRSAIETIGEAFVVYDSNDRLAFCNEKYREVHRASAAVIETGRSFEEIIRYGVARGQYPQALGREEEWIAERMAMHRQGEHDLIQQTGDGRWLRVTERRTSAGHTVGFRVDVTELYAAKNAAEAANIAKSQFLATMSHEIRTPMNAILGMAQVLQMQDVAPRDRKDYARTIVSAGDTMLALLNNILDLSKIEAGELTLDPVPLEAEQLMRETIALFFEVAQSKDLKIEGRWRGQKQRYLGDAVRLSQMLSNLISNALKFSERGGVRVEAREVSLEGTTALLEFAVTDSGIGISPDQQARLFQAFSQADSSITRKYGGTGLGLSIVRSLAQSMGGEYGMESEVGHGSRFWFRVRLEVLEPSDEPMLRGEVAAVDQRADPRLRCRVLVFEDNLTNQALVKAMLAKLGASMVLATDGGQWREALTQGEAADLVLMDLQMPVMDGFDAAANIRLWEQENGLPRRPIVALTANAFDEDRRRCMAVGMDDVLVKPVKLADLRNAITRWLPDAHNAPQASVTVVNSARISDPSRVLELVQEVTTLLEQNRFDSIRRFSELQDALAATDLVDELERARQPLKQFRFDLALERLQSTLASAKWKMAING